MFLSETALPLVEEIGAGGWSIIHWLREIWPGAVTLFGRWGLKLVKPPAIGQKLFLCLLEATICFFGGVNDQTLADYSNILQAVKKAHARAVVTLVPYTSAGEKTNEVTNFNRQLEQLCQEQNVKVVDLNPVIAPNGKLLPKYTIDGVHFSQAAYSVWEKKLRIVVAAIQHE